MGDVQNLSKEKCILSELYTLEDKHAVMQVDIYVYINIYTFDHGHNVLTFFPY